VELVRSQNMTTFKLKVIHLLNCSVENITVLLLTYCKNSKAGL
jgi:hypothetical protein